ncbi:hypothetical protein J468_3746 [Acinetobacter baumannii 1043903]|nr:hypothetical protein J468_3746 [Acinetobacter baumannii 1043903]
MIKVIYKQDALSEDKTIEHAETLGNGLLQNMTICLSMSVFFIL